MGIPLKIKYANSGKKIKVIKNLNSPAIALKKVLIP
jgi:hypothetical protein